MRDTSLVYPGRTGRKDPPRTQEKGHGFWQVEWLWRKDRGGRNDARVRSRELFEESGLKARPEDLIPVGDLYFHQPSDPEWSHAGIVYFVKVWEGTPAETEEMQPKWFLPSEFPYENMWWPTACGCL